MSWTKEEEELAVRLWKDSGQSAAQIAEQLPGKSRNAVIGKLSRLGFLGTGAGVRQTPSRPGAAKRPKPKPKPKLTRRVSPAPQVPPVARDWGPCTDNPPAEHGTVTIGNVGYGQCRWPTGDPRDAQDMPMCGAKALEGRPYCAAHHEVARRDNRGERVAAPRAGVQVWGEAA